MTVKALYNTALMTTRRQLCTWCAPRTTDMQWKNVWPDKLIRYFRIALQSSVEDVDYLSYLNFTCTNNVFIYSISKISLFMSMTLQVRPYCLRPVLEPSTMASYPEAP